MNKIEEKIRLLKDCFARRTDVLMAFVFGSYAHKQETRESDVDIAVYFRPEGKGTDGQVCVNSEKEDQIRPEIIDIVEKDLDLICMNNAPASLVSNIIKTGIPLDIKDNNLYWDTYLRASMEAEDFSEFAEDYFEIYRRARSLVPEQKTRFLERLQFLDTELEEIEKFKRLTFKEYREDKTQRRNIERWAENIINAIIDTAKIILASEKKTMPKTYEAALRDLGIFAGLTEEDSRKFSKLANLRNILAHEYLDILYERIQSFILEFPPLYKKIVESLEKYWSGRDNGDSSNSKGSPRRSS